MPAFREAPGPGSGTAPRLDGDHGGGGPLYGIDRGAARDPVDPDDLSDPVDPVTRAARRAIPPVPLATWRPGDLELVILTSHCSGARNYRGG